jgi:hypothetical protein
LSHTDYSTIVDSEYPASLRTRADLLWRKVRISRTNRSARNIGKLLDKKRAVLLGLQQMVSLSEPDGRGVVTTTPSDTPEGNPGEPIGHAVVVVGKATIGRTLHFLIRNSWGQDWARGGYGFIDRRYVDLHGRDAAIVDSIID